jgi:hypothetical protein
LSGPAHHRRKLALRSSNMALALGKRSALPAGSSPAAPPLPTQAVSLSIRRIDHMVL